MFPTADGHINIAVAGGVMYERFCNAVGKQEWITDERFDTGPKRSKNRAAMNEVIGELTVTKTSNEWVEMFEEVGVPCGPIYNMAEMFADPQVKHLQMATPVQHPRMGEFEVVNQAIKLSRTPHQIRTATPEQGEHTDEILSGLGYDDATIKAMHEKGVV